MPQLTISTNAKKVAEKLGVFVGLLEPALLKAIRYVAKDAKDELAVPGKKPTYPIHWDSEAQRKKFFATNGFDGGIPHIRTDRLVGGWKAERSDNGAIVSNSLTGARYVWGNAQGVGQSKIHVGRWPLMRDIVDKAIARLPTFAQDALRNLWKRGEATTL